MLHPSAGYSALSHARQLAQIHRSYSLCTPLTHQHWIAVLAHSNTELLRVFHSLVKANQWIVFIDYFHPSDRKYSLCCLHIYKLISHLFCIKNCFSTENTLVHIYKHTSIPVSRILHSSVCLKKSLCMSFFLHSL